MTCKSPRPTDSVAQSGIGPDFDAGAVYTDGSPADLETRIRELLAGLPAYRSAIRAWHARRDAEWRERLSALEGALAALHAPAVAPVSSLAGPLQASAAAGTAQAV